jgi:hypothetical protein
MNIATALTTRKWNLNLVIPIGLASFCLAIQLVAASLVVTSFDSPNSSTLIAENLAKHGTYACGPCTVRLHGTDRSGEPLRMFHLPGESLYLAACFRYLPSGLLHYAHAPFTALLVLAASYVALKLAGKLLAVVAGLLATLEPFVILHGSVWDDTFLGASLDWAVFALLVMALESGGRTDAGWKRALRVTMIAVLAGYASITRSSSQFTLLAVGFTILFLRSLRSIRLEALAATAGVILALATWGYRNYTVFGQFAAGSSHDGISFWESVYPSAREALLTHGQTEGLNNQRMQEDFARTSSLGELETNRYFFRRAVRYLVAEPADVVWTALVKIAVGSVGLRTAEPYTSARNVVGLLSNSVLLVLAAFGAAVQRFRVGPPRVLWRCIAGSNLLVYIGFSVFGPIGLRYRMSLEPVLWIYAASCLTYVAGRLRARIPDATHIAARLPG